MKAAPSPENKKKPAAARKGPAKVQAFALQQPSSL
jgi:hypothetical protein